MTAKVVSISSYKPDLDCDLTYEEQEQQLNDFIRFAMANPASGCGDGIEDCTLDSLPELYALVDTDLPENFDIDSVSELSKSKQLQILNRAIAFILEVRGNLKRNHDLTYRD